MTQSTSTVVVTESWIARHRRRIVEVGIGHTLYAAFGWLCDNPLYVYVVYRFGLLRGGAIMMTFSLTQCALTLIVYERMQIDWVGVGSLARVASIPDPSWWQRVIVWTSRHGNFAIFLALCMLQDPFITTAYFRQGRFDGLAARDWGIFLASVIVSNVYWTVRSGAVAAILVGAWHGLGHP